MSEQLAEISQLQCLGRLSTGPGCFICSGNSRPPLSSPPACRPLTRRTHKSGDRRCPHFGSRTGPYRCRTGPDSVCFGGSPVFARAGTRFESHLGTCFPCSVAFWCFFVWTVSTLLPLIGCSGWVGSRIDLFGCGGAADYGGPRTALRGLCWVFILVRPSVGFSRSPVHGGWGRVQHDLLPLPPQSCMNRGRSENSGPAANPGPCKEQKPFFC